MIFSMTMRNFNPIFGRLGAKRMNKQTRLGNRSTFSTTIMKGSDILLIIVSTVWVVVVQELNYELGCYLLSPRRGSHGGWMRL
jgi:hypothetical protein